MEKTFRNKKVSNMLEILIRTPFWVWIIFGYIIFIGIKLSKTHIVYIPKLLIMPIIFTSMKYKIFIDGGMDILLQYLSGLLSGLFIGYLLESKKSIKVIKESFSVELQGSYKIFIILMLFFIIKFIFGHTKHMDLELYMEYGYIELVATGILSGYFLGRVMLYMRKIFN